MSGAQDQREQGSLPELPEIRMILGRHAPRALPFGEPLGAEHGPRGQGAVLDRRAAVAVVLRTAAAGCEVLLIRRAEHPDDPWSGHMAFPGGREDPGDRDALATALRETREEIGLDLALHGSLLGALDPLPAVAAGRPTGMRIDPFAFELRGAADGPEPELTPNEEVAEIVWAPLNLLASDQLATTIPYHHQGQQFDLPGWDFEGRVVWGLTYHMLQALFTVLRRA